jgi:site-specific DNA-methyltransferase (adenine-specific)
VPGRDGEIGPQPPAGPNREIALFFVAYDTRAVVAFEDSGFLLRDVLAWKKDSAHHRAQRVSEIFKKRGLEKESVKWEGWRLGNLAPIYEPIAWFFKPYKSVTITDNILKFGVGAMNIGACKINGSSPTNLLEFGFEKGETRIHEAQKPVKIMEFLIKLTTRQNQLVLDPFMGSGTTALAANNLNRHFIGFEICRKYYDDSVERLKNNTSKGSRSLINHSHRQRSIQPPLLDSIS